MGRAWRSISQRQRLRKGLCFEGCTLSRHQISSVFTRSQPFAGCLHFGRTLSDCARDHSARPLAGTSKASVVQGCHVRGDAGTCRAQLCPD